MKLGKEKEDTEQPAVILPGEVKEVDGKVWSRSSLCSKLPIFKNIRNKRCCVCVCKCMSPGMLWPWVIFVSFICILVGVAAMPASD